MIIQRIALVVLVSWVVLAACAPLLNLQPDLVDLTRILHGPDFEAPLGHDELGRPLLDRLIAGAHVSLLVAVSVVSLSVLLGTLIGTCSAWIGGVADHLIVRIIDVFLAFPGILLAIALAGILGPGIENVVLALTTVGWVGFARLSRAQTLSLKHREHVLAAVALGARVPRILACHVIPLMAAPLIVEATFGIAAVIIAEAGLSFLGLGVQPPQASWGSIIQSGTRYLLVAPHLVIVPAVALSMVVLAVNLLGDQMRDRLDVRGDRGSSD